MLAGQTVGRSGTLVARGLLSARTAGLHLRPLLPCRGLLCAGGGLDVPASGHRPVHTHPSALPRPLRRTRRKIDRRHRLAPGRQSGGEQRGGAQPHLYSGREPDEMGLALLGGNPQRGGRLCPSRKLLRRGGYRCALLGRGDVSQRPRRHRRVVAGRRGPLCRASTANPHRRVAGPQAGRSAHLQHLHL